MEDGVNHRPSPKVALIPYATTGSWFGYTAPSAYISPTDHLFHLFSVFLVSQGGPNNARQVAIAHSTSSDGLNYQVVQEQIFIGGQGDWKDQNVRSPSPMEDNGQIKFWFAGDSYIPYFSSGWLRQQLVEFL
jgi:hypothetical protein